MNTSFNEGFGGEGVNPKEKAPACRECKDTGVIEIKAEESVTGVPANVDCGSCGIAEERRKSKLGEAFK